MMKYSAKNKGFTLIEVLTALIIIVLVTSVSIVAVNSSKKNARDTRRKEDLNSIAAALQLYYQDKLLYPMSGDTTEAWLPSSFPAASSQWISGLSPEYIPTLPLDPRNNATSISFKNTASTGYSYIYASYTYSSYIKGMWYALATKLENGEDKDAVGKNCLKWLDGTKTWSKDNCGANHVGWLPQMYVKLNK